MIKVGRVCVKIAGREAGCLCVIVDVVNDKFVIIDGDVKRRKCNISHLDFVPVLVDIKKNASRDEVREALKKAGFKLRPEKKKKEEKKETKKKEKKQKKKKEEKKKEK